MANNAQRRSPCWSPLWQKHWWIGQDEERKIAFMKGCGVFNVEQIERLPEHYYAKPEPVIDPALPPWS